MTPLFINTNDREFFKEITRHNHEGIKFVSLKLEAQAAEHTVLEFAEQFGIALLSTGAVELFKVIIKNFSDKEPPANTTVNNINIRNNYGQIINIIENNEKGTKDNLDQDQDRENQ